MALVSIRIVVGHLLERATIGNYVLGCVSLCVLVLYVPCMFCVHCMGVWVLCLNGFL